MKSLFILAFILLGTLAQAADKPNIICTLAEDMGYGDAGCYGRF